MLASEWYQHQLNPVAFSIFGQPVAWYWLNYLFGFLFCWFLVDRFRDPSLSRDAWLDLKRKWFLWGWFGLLVGARVGFILIYNFKWYLKNPFEVIAIWNGGMSFHGALWGIALAWFFLAKDLKVFLSWTDRLCVLIPWPLATGRVCNFINGELPGRISDVPWAVVFPAPWNDGPRHPSQLYQAGLEGVLLGIFMLLLSRKCIGRHGLLTSWFLMLYGVLRFMTEFSREADSSLGYLWLGLTMGQWLCLGMIAIAIPIMIVSLRSKRHQPASNSN